MLTESISSSKKPFVIKYDPKKIADVVGQNSVIKKIVEYIKNFKKGSKGLLLYGPVGCGKTSIVTAIANETHFEKIEVNASDFRNKDQINSILGNAMKQMSLFSQGKIILVDEIDGLSGTKDRGGIGAIASLIKTSNFPVICTANDPSDKKFSELRKVCNLIEANTLSHEDIALRLKEICKNEKIECDEVALKTLARNAAGDLRSAINDLEFITIGSDKLSKEELELLPSRNKEEKIKNALLKVFKIKDVDIVRNAYDNVDENVDQISLWLEENIPREYLKPGERSDAFYYLSRAKFFDRRIRRNQYWRFLAYIYDFLSSGIAVSKVERNKRPVEYVQTTRLLKLWKAKMSYAKRNSICEKMAAKTHESRKSLIKDYFYFKYIFKNNVAMAKEIAEEFELSADEIAYLKK